MQARVAPCQRSDLCREQVKDDAVLISRPHAAVFAQEGCARAFFSTETERTIHKAIYEPFESNWDFIQDAA